MHSAYGTDKPVPCKRKGLLFLHKNQTGYPGWDILFSGTIVLIGFERKSSNIRDFCTVQRLPCVKGAVAA